MNRHTMKHHRRAAKLKRLVEQAVRIADCNSIKTVCCARKIPTVTRETAEAELDRIYREVAADLVEKLLADKLLEEHLFPSPEGGLSLGMTIRIATRQPIPVIYER
jgi:hypothetical protein